MMAHDISTDDRRRVVNAGVRHGRDALIANLRATAEVGVESMTTDVVATRGERLALSRVRCRPRPAARGVHDEVLMHRRDRRRQADSGRRRVRRRRHRRCLGRTRRPVPRRRSGRVHTNMVGHHPSHRGIQPTRTPPGDAEPGGHRPSPWSVIRARRTVRVSPFHMGFHPRGDPSHRSSARAEQPRSRRYPRGPCDLTDGFAAEWRVINVLTVEGDLISGCEVFDETDLDAALARFDELSAPVSRLNNAASRAERALPDVLRFPRLGSDGGDIGRRHCHRRSPPGRECRHPARPRCRTRKLADPRRPRCHDVTSTVIATRGERLALSRPLRVPASPD